MNLIDEFLTFFLSIKRMRSRRDKWIPAPITALFVVCAVLTPQLTSTLRPQVLGENEIDWDAWIGLLEQQPQSEAPHLTERELFDLFKGDAPSAAPDSAPGPMDEGLLSDLNTEYPAIFSPSLWQEAFDMEDSDDLETKPSPGPLATNSLLSPSSPSVIRPIPSKTSHVEAPPQYSSNPISTTGLSLSTPPHSPPLSKRPSLATNSEVITFPPSPVSTYSITSEGSKTRLHVPAKNFAKNLRNFIANTNMARGLPRNAIKLTDECLEPFQAHKFSFSQNGSQKSSPVSLSLKLLVTNKDKIINFDEETLIKTKKLLKERIENIRKSQTQARVLPPSVKTQAPSKLSSPSAKNHKPKINQLNYDKIIEEANKNLLRNYSKYKSSSQKHLSVPKNSLTVHRVINKKAPRPVPFVSAPTRKNN